MRPVVYIEAIGIRFMDPLYSENHRRWVAELAAQRAAKVIRHYGYEAVVMDNIVDWLEVFCRRNRALSRCPLVVVTDRYNRRLENAVQKAMEPVNAIDRRERWWATLMWSLRGRDPYAEAGAALAATEKRLELSAS